MKIQFFLRNMEQIWKQFKSRYIKEDTLRKGPEKNLFFQNKVKIEITIV